MSSYNRPVTGRHFRIFYLVKETAFRQTMNPPKRLLSPLILSYIGALAALVLFERLADEISEGDTLRFDLAVRGFIHGFASPGMTVFMKVLTDIGTLTLMLPFTLAAGFALWYFGRRRGAILMAVTMAGSLLLMFVLKLLFHRQRPDPYFGFPLPKDFSFPSGHALTSFCFWGLLAVILSTEVQTLASRIVIWAVAVFMVFGVGLSRIYLGVHYPSDVLGGYLAATVWVSGVGWVYRHFRHTSESPGNIGQQLTGSG